MTLLPSLLPSEPRLEKSLPWQGLRLPVRCCILLKPSCTVLPLLVHLDSSLSLPPPKKNQPTANQSGSAAAACSAVTAFACFRCFFPFLELSSAGSTRCPHGWSLAGMLGVGVCSSVRLSPQALHLQHDPPRGKKEGYTWADPKTGPVTIQGAH